ncbi:MAG TPA: DUF3592 domain-containing protein [Acidobacteriaceae bacterium]|nr:DUF3592 domain-containing protein [Acidobacteriaceae bacterium]
MSTPFEWTNPRTWPLIFDAWLAITVAGGLHSLWKWNRVKRGTGWPVVPGRIVWTEVRAKDDSWSFGQRNGENFTAEIGFEYSLEGQSYSGDFSRDSGTEDEAREFIRDLDGKMVMVSYNPRKPTDATLTDTALADVLKTRAFDPVEAWAAATRRELPEWVKPWLWLLIAISAAGFAVSLWVHIEALADREIAPQSLFWILHFVLFVVCFPAGLVAIRRVGSTQRRDFWKAVLRGSPLWVRLVLYGVMGYETIIVLLAFVHNPLPGNQDGTSATDWRTFSGLWLVFYFAAFAIFYSAAIAEKTLLEPPRQPPVQP